MTKSRDYTTFFDILLSPKPSPTETALRVPLKQESLDTAARRRRNRWNDSEGRSVSVLLAEYPQVDWLSVWCCEQNGVKRKLGSLLAEVDHQATGSTVDRISPGDSIGSPWAPQMFYQLFLMVLKDLF